MNKQTAIAIIKSINRHIRNHWFGGMRGWDYATWTVVYPQMAHQYSAAAQVITGRPGRYLPKA